MDNIIHCKNCESEIQDSFDYCPFCGQKAQDELTIQVLFNNTISNYFSVDARFFRSFLPLLLKPGVLARRFVDGKRQVYLHPAQYYLFISVIFFFLFSLVTREDRSELEQDFNSGLSDAMKPDSISVSEMLSKNENIDPAALRELESLDSVINKDYSQTYGSAGDGFNITGDVLDSLIKNGATDEEKLASMGYKETDGPIKRVIYEQILKLVENRGGGFLQVFYDIIPIAMFFVLPIFALLLKLFYWKRGRFSHHMVFSFYYFTFIFLLFSLVMLVSFWVEIPWWIIMILVFITFAYLWSSSHKFYRQGWFVVFIKSSIVSFTYTMFIIPVSFIFMVLISFLLY